MMTDRNETYGNPSANYLMQRVWDAEHPAEGSMVTGIPRIHVPASSVAHVCKSLRAAIKERDAALAANRDCVDHFEQMRAERDELRMRIDNAEVGTVCGMEVLFDSESWGAKHEGKRVALVPLEK